MRFRGTQFEKHWSRYSYNEVKIIPMPTLAARKAFE
jgi:hypothetical protein